MKKVLKALIWSLAIVVIAYFGVRLISEKNLFNIEFDITTTLVLSLLLLAFVNITTVIILSFFSISAGKK